jgi:hypothetical protein
MPLAISHFISVVKYPISAPLRLCAEVVSTGHRNDCL